MNERKFHHYVMDKTEHVEMEIFSSDGITFTVHFPRYEALVPNSAHIEFRKSQILMFLFAYDERELYRFSEKLSKDFSL